MNESQPAQPDTNQIIEERRAKLSAIRESGVAFPNDFNRQTSRAICNSDSTARPTRSWKRSRSR